MKITINQLVRDALLGKKIVVTQNYQTMEQVIRTIESVEVCGGTGICGSFVERDHPRFFHLDADDEIEVKESA